MIEPGIRRILSFWSGDPLLVGRGLDRYMSRLWARETKLQRSAAVAVAQNMVGLHIAAVHIDRPGASPGPDDAPIVNATVEFGDGRRLLLDRVYLHAVGRVARQVKAASKRNGRPVTLRRADDPGPFFGLYFQVPDGERLPVLSGGLRTQTPA